MYPTIFSITIFNTEDYENDKLGKKNHSRDLLARK